jgi:hypothetical protein
MAQDVLFVTRNDIVRFTAMNGAVDPDKFFQWIKTAQDLHIQNYLGTRLFEKLKTDIENGTLVDPYENLLDTYIKPMLIHYAMIEYLPFASYVIGNKGVFKHTSETGEVVGKDEVDSLIEKERDLAQHYTQRFIDFMCFNQSSFPEYNQNSNGDVYPTMKNEFGGWHL